MHKKRLVAKSDGGIMKKRVIQLSRGVAIFLGLGNIVGFIWYADYFISEPWGNILFSLSPGIALLSLSFIPESYLGYRGARILSALIGITAVVHEIHKINSDLTLPNYPDIGAIVIRAFTVIVLVVLILRATSPKTCLEQKRDSDR